MKVIRAQKGNEDFYAVLEGDLVKKIVGEPFEKIELSGDVFKLADVSLLAPSIPSKIVAVGLNYRAHAEEVGKSINASPILFIKPSTTVIAPGEAVVYPAQSKRVDYEAELGVVIGKRTHAGMDPKEAIFGYTCLNDVTARDLQSEDGQWTRGKSFDTFCPLGPHIETELDPASARIRAILNGKTVQDSNTSDLITDVYSLISFITSIMTLLPGDVVATGTPAGIGPMERGDTITISIDGIGELSNIVK